MDIFASERMLIASVLLVFFICNLVQTGNSLKILTISVNHNSHANLFSVAAEILQSRGHDVVMLNHPRFHDMFEKKGLKVLPYRSTVQVTSEDAAKDAIKARPSFFETFRLVEVLLKDTFMKNTDDYFADAELQKKIADYKFDIAIVDSGLDRTTCLIPYKYDIPYISLTPMTLSFQVGVPALLSVEPNPALPFSDNMSFSERLVNFLTSIIFELNFPPWWIDSDSYVSKYVPGKPLKTMKDIFLNSRLFFANWDILALGFPKISASYLRYVTGLNARNPKPLSGEINERVNSVKSDIIVFTMGSLFRRLPQDKLQIFLEAFGRLKESVFMAYKGDPPKDVPKNVYMERWLPQNDLLGHPRTKLFITHGGNSGALEALYHGTPTLAFPMAGDQDATAARSLYRGVGLSLDFHTFTADELYETIQELLTNKSYSENMKRASRIYHGLPNAADEFVFWTEHVAEFGSDHLRSRALTMPWYQLFMVDVFVLFMVVIHLTIFFSICCCKFCYRKCCGTKTGTKDKKKSD